MKLFDPTSGPAPRGSLKAAARPPSLAGLRLGLVDNTKFNSDTLLHKLAERLGRHGATVTLTSRKRSPSHEIDEAAVKALRSQADLVVSGIGD